MPSTRVKPSVFLPQCISIASKFVNCHEPLQFTQIDRVKGVFVLRNKIDPIYLSGNPTFFLMEVKNAKMLYLHVSVTLKAPKKNAAIDSNHEFEGASLQFFQGKGRLFCRAEWDVKKKPDKLEHPQPHWHWGSPDKTDSKGFVESDSDGEGFQIQLEESSPEEETMPEINFEELHYAMSSKWASSDSAVEEFTPQRFISWMECCIGNVIDQYNYQVSKSGFVSVKGR